MGITSSFLRELKNYKKSLLLNSMQKELIIGSMLGDGNLRITGKNREANFIVDHSLVQKKYVLWKYGIMKEWVFTEPKIITRVYHKDTSRILSSLRFLSISHHEFSKWYHIFYKDRKKIIPLNINEILKSPLALAVWVMDDGNKNHNAVFLNTQQFTIEEQQLLVNCLKNNFGIEARINKHSMYGEKQLYRIRLTTPSTKMLYLLVQEFILPSMHYKFPFYIPVTTCLEEFKADGGI